MKKNIITKLIKKADKIDSERVREQIRKERAEKREFKREIARKREILASAESESKTYERDIEQTVKEAEIEDARRSTGYYERQAKRKENKKLDILVGKKSAKRLRAEYKAQQRMVDFLTEAEEEGFEVPERLWNIANREIPTRRVMEDTHNKRMMLFSISRTKSLIPDIEFSEVGQGPTKATLTKKAGESDAEAWARNWLSAAKYQTRVATTKYGKKQESMTDWVTVKDIIQKYTKMTGESVGDHRFLIGQKYKPEAVAKFIRSITKEQLVKLYELGADEELSDYLDAIYDRPWNRETAKDYDRTILTKSWRSYDKNYRSIEFKDYKYIVDMIMDTKEWDVFKRSGMYDSEQVYMLDEPGMKPKRGTHEIARMRDFFASKKYTIKELWDLVLTQGKTLDDALSELGFPDEGYDEND